jgi:hypothetical protein
VTSYMVVDEPELEPKPEPESERAAAPDADADAEYDVPPIFGHAPNLPDWFDISRHRSAHFLAEKTCEMICYLWFAGARSLAPSSSSASNAAAASSYPSPPGTSPYPRSSPNPATALQLSASPVFVQFMQKVLETTQVSQSVIVLSLHYIYRLKERNSLSSGQPGSEFRIAIAALMMANKFLDEYAHISYLQICSSPNLVHFLFLAIRIPTRLGPKSLVLTLRKSTKWKRNSFRELTIRSMSTRVHTSLGCTYSRAS